MWSIVPNSIEDNTIIDTTVNMADIWVMTLIESTDKDGTKDNNN